MNNEEFPIKEDGVEYEKVKDEYIMGKPLKRTERNIWVNIILYIIYAMIVTTTILCVYGLLN